MPPKPTRTPERIELPGGYWIETGNGPLKRQWLISPESKRISLFGLGDGAQTFAAAMNASTYGASRVTDPEHQAAQKELNRIRTADVAALQGPATIIINRIKPLADAAGLNIEHLAKRLNVSEIIAYSWYYGAAQAPSSYEKMLDVQSPAGECEETLQPPVSTYSFDIRRIERASGVGIELCDGVLRVFIIPAPTGEG